MQTLKNIIKTMGLALLAVTVIATSVNAQSDKKELSKKLNEVKGKAESITITTDEGEFQFDGKQAKELLKRMKGLHWVSKMNGLKFLSEDDSDANVYFYSDGDDVDHNVFFYDEDDLHGVAEFLIDVDEVDDVDHSSIQMIIDTDDDGTTKEVKIEQKDGEKKVTVTTTDGDDIDTKVYEGEEADEYLEELDLDDDIHINLSKKHKFIIKPNKKMLGSHIKLNKFKKYFKGKNSKIIIVDEDDEGSVYEFKINGKKKKEIIIKKKKSKKEDDE